MKTKFEVSPKSIGIGGAGGRNEQRFAMIDTKRIAVSGMNRIKRLETSEGERVWINLDAIALMKNRNGKTRIVFSDAKTQKGETLAITVKESPEEILKMK